MDEAKSYESTAAERHFNLPSPVLVEKHWYVVRALLPSTPLM
jgi:hypothetical protein